MQELLPLSRLITLKRRKSQQQHNNQSNAGVNKKSFAERNNHKRPEDLEAFAQKQDIKPVITVSLFKT